MHEGGIRGLRSHGRDGKTHARREAHGASEKIPEMASADEAAWVEIIGELSRNSLRGNGRAGRVKARLAADAH